MRIVGDGTAVIRSRSVEMYVSAPLVMLENVKLEMKPLLYGGCSISSDPVVVSEQHLGG